MNLTDEQIGAAVEKIVNDRPPLSWIMPQVPFDPAEPLHQYYQRVRKSIEIHESFVKSQDSLRLMMIGVLIRKLFSKSEID